MSLYQIVNTRNIVVCPGKFEREVANAKALELAVSSGNMVKAIPVAPDKVTVRKVITAQANHAHLQMVVARPRKSDKKQKVMRVGTLDEVRDYCIAFYKRNGYRPAIRPTPLGVVAGQYV